MSQYPKQQKKVAAQQRLATALRDNLKRRKAQVKARAQGLAKAAEHDSAGITLEIAPHKPKG
jgi:hypothetical protein